MDLRKATQRLSCVLMFVTAAFPLAAITPAPTAQTCEAVMQWARDNRDSLPRDYRGQLAFPVDQRRAIYSNMSAAEKATYWNDRIGVYLEEHPQLTAGQQNALAEARAFVQADVFEGIQKPGMATNAVREQEVARFSDRMVAGLGEKATHELFYGFGPGAAEQRAASVTCECRNLGDCLELGINASFCNRPYDCEQVTGCGFLNNMLCDGMCWFKDVPPNS